MKTVLSGLRASFILLVLFTLLLGIAYPLLVTAIAQITFYHKANGSLIEQDGQTIGSELLGQSFSESRYFWGRLSANGYNAASSGGSNLSPANPALAKAVSERVAALQKADPKNKSKIPVDLVTASASGLDPHISTASALYQVPRVARARKLTESELIDLVFKHAHAPVLGFLGEPRVNVLEVNLALDKK